jgi:hypothetical protein
LIPFVDEAKLLEQVSKISEEELKILSDGKFLSMDTSMITFILPDERSRNRFDLPHIYRFDGKSKQKLVPPFDLFHHFGGICKVKEYPLTLNQDHTQDFEKTDRDSNEDDSEKKQESKELNKKNKRRQKNAKEEGGSKLEVEDKKDDTYCPPFPSLSPFSYKLSEERIRINVVGSPSKGKTMVLKPMMTIPIDWEERAAQLIG